MIDFRQDFAGVGGNVTYLKSAMDAKYYTPLVADIVGLIHVQGGILNEVGNNPIRMLDHFQMGPNLVRGFAPNGIGPRDINPYGTQDALGGTKYWGASLELQMPFWFLPKEMGLKGAVYADAGGLYDYQGPTNWDLTGEVNVPGCIPPTNNPKLAPAPGTCLGLQYDNEYCSHVGRCRPDLASPFGPLRFDYAVPITKGPHDCAAIHVRWRQVLACSREYALGHSLRVRSPAGPRRVEWRNRFSLNNRLRRRWQISPR